MITTQFKNFKEITRELEKIEAKSEMVVKRTTGDFKSRAPAWISAAVTEVYGVKKSRVKDSLTGKNTRGKIRVKGKIIDNYQLIYEGRSLTPINFKMKPAQRPTPTKSGRARPYQVTAEIYKGKRKVLGGQVFIAPGQGGVQLPFQRVGKARMPIDVVRTLSVPQMITNEQVAADIQERINEGLGGRLDHHLQRELGKK